MLNPLEAIAVIGQQVHPGMHYHPTTVAYIQYLVRPYNEAINYAQDIESITRWVNLEFPGNLSKYAIIEMNKAILQNRGAIDSLSVAKNAVIEYILVELLEVSGNRARDEHDIVVLPWDVQIMIGFDKELTIMFNIAKGDVMLPVTVMIQNQPFQHMLSMDFVTGLLVFYYASNNPINITMFNVPITNDYFITDGFPDLNSRYIIDRFTFFTVDVSDIRFKFDTSDFMQGFATGASWKHVDHHKYWTNLMSHTHNASTQITF